MRERHPMLGVAGVLFLAIAGAGAWWATGHALDDQALRFGVPTLLILLGLLAITLGRR